MNIAIIPARSGSKRIPHKNIKDFFGKPIIAHAIQNALDSEIFERVIVSTDSEEIAQIARDFGAQTPFLRPKHLADDFATTLEVIAHALKEINAKADDRICALYPCTPLLDSQILKKAYLEFENAQNIEYLFAALEFENSPFRGFCLDSENGVELLFKEFENARSQDLKRVFYDAGQFYFGKAHFFANQAKIFTPKSIAFVLDHFHAQDVDTPRDWELLEMKYQIKKMTN